MAKPAKSSPEVTDRAVRVVLEHQREYASQCEVIRPVAGKIGCNQETLWRWVRRAETDAG